MATLLKGQGVHFAGSLGQTDVETSFDKFGALGTRVKRIPDGEPGLRDTWCVFQNQAFGPRKELQPDQISYIDNSAFDTEEEALAIVASLPPADTQYDAYAISSYKIFRAKKEAGIIAPSVRFQVSLPTTYASLFVFNSKLRPYLEKPYTEGLMKAMKNIQSAIPHDELAIQIDIAPELAMLENNVFGLNLWFSPAKEGFYERIAAQAEAIEKDVEFGLHLCYGDLDHKHWKEPEDTSLLATVFIELKELIKRPVNWVMLPVPINRDDAAYFEPLKKLQSARGDTDVYMGVVHAHDPEGTQRRIARAKEVVWPFGIATECGLGRTPAADISSIIQILADQAE